MAKVLDMDVRVGDRILIDGSIEGVVGFSSISNDYSTECRREDYSGEENDGILIIQENGARIFHDTEYLLNDFCTIKILERHSANSPQKQLYLR